MAGSKNNKEAAISSSILGLVRGLSDEQLIAQVMRHKIPRDDAGMIIADAKKRIQLTADFNRNEQLGLAIKRLNRILELSMPSGEQGDELHDEIKSDLPVAIRAQVELNKLLKLHEVPAGNSGDPDEPGSDRGDELERVRAHLSGVLDEVPDDYPVSELARIAADRVRAAHAGD